MARLRASKFPLRLTPSPNMLDFLSAILRAFCVTAAVLIFLLSLPFVIAHVIDNWDAPEYPHSGFSPECPTWEAPECEYPAPREWEQYQNTLPPTEHDLAAGCSPRPRF